jgi:hypothetical protein
MIFNFIIKNIATRVSYKVLDGLAIALSRIFGFYIPTNHYNLLSKVSRRPNMLWSLDVLLRTKVSQMSSKVLFKQLCLLEY